MNLLHGTDLQETLKKTTFYAIIRNLGITQ
jgi:hypothetical protein